MNRVGRLSRRGWMALAAMAAMASLVAVPPALAHALPAGLGGALEGAVQLLLSPADLLLVCGLCALAVQNGEEPGPRLRLVLPAAWLLGGAVGLGRPAELAMPWSTTLAFTLVGLLVAWRCRWVSGWPQPWRGWRGWSAASPMAPSWRFTAARRWRWREVPPPSRCSRRRSPRR